MDGLPALNPVHPNRVRIACGPFLGSEGTVVGRLHTRGAAHKQPLVVQIAGNVFAYPMHWQVDPVLPQEAE